MGRAAGKKSRRGATLPSRGVKGNPAAPIPIVSIEVPYDKRTHVEAAKVYDQFVREHSSPQSFPSSWAGVKS